MLPVPQLKSGRIAALLLLALAVAWTGAAGGAADEDADTRRPTTGESDGVARTEDASTDSDSSDAGDADADDEAESTEGSAEAQDSKGPLTPASRWQSAGSGVSPRRPDRWAMLDAVGVQLPRGSIIDPYNQNLIKGDFPFPGTRTFFKLDALLNPVVVDDSQDNGDTLINTNITIQTELFHGSTVFKPKDWAFKLSGKGLVQDGGNDIEDASLLEAFGEVKIADVSANYDFISFRGGVQFFKSDFNGFIFQDFNLGGQFFGDLNANRNQFTLAFVTVQESQASGGIQFDSQDQDVIFANWFQEDLFVPGFDVVFSVVHNQDEQLLQLLGIEQSVTYVGFNSQGHLGRVVVNPTLYVATGEIDFGGGVTNDISGYMFGVDFQFPKNYLNYRGAVFMTSGDDDPTDGDDEGFDAIKDNVNLFGGATSFVIGGGNLGTRPNSFIPSFRGLGTQSNFNNPGIVVVNAGIDAVLMPQLFFEGNINYFQLVEGEAQGAPADDLGSEVNIAVTWRVFLNENFVIKAAVNVFAPGDAGEFILGNDENITTTTLNVVGLF